MTQISRPFQIVLVAFVLFVGVWFLALQGHTSTTTGGSGSSASAPSRLRRAVHGDQGQNDRVRALHARDARHSRCEHRHGQALGIDDRRSRDGHAHDSRGQTHHRRDDHEAR